MFCWFTNDAKSFFKLLFTFTSRIRL